MAVHHELADLVRTAGADILDNADAFRAALDDFLAENAVTEGELNLLVDAVRLGALSRLTEQVGHGGEAALVVAEHGDRLARNRGTQETGGARWALAALGFSLGLVGEDHVRARRAEMTSRTPPAMSFDPTSPPAQARQGPALEAPIDAVTKATPTLRRLHTGSTGTAAATSRRLPLVLLAAGVAAVLALGAGVGAWLGSGDEDPWSNSSDESSQATDAATEDGAGDDSDGPLDSPIASEDTRLDAMEAATTFVEGFNTYGPEQLDSAGRLPDYRETADLMTSSFAEDFMDNVGYAEETVSQLGAASVATVYGSGIAGLDEAAATVLVGGTIELTYPDPDGGSDVSTGPQRFRYVVSLEYDEERGTWLVGNLDDIDDGLPPFGDAKGSEPAPQAPNGEPPGTWLADVVDTAQDAVPIVLSYGYRSFDADIQHGDEYLTAEFADERRTLFKDLRGQVIDDEVVVTTELSASALGAGGETEVDVFVFLDQASAKHGGEPRKLEMWATLEMVLDANNQWLVNGIETGN